MVADDTYADRFIAERNILKYHFAEEVVLKDSAQVALDYLIEFSHMPDKLPQVIFVDMYMPGMDGFGFLEEYAKLPDDIKSKCIIFLISALFNPKDKERLEKNVLVNRLLSKPVDKELLDKLTTEKIK